MDDKFSKVTLAPSRSKRHCGFSEAKTAISRSSEAEAYRGSRDLMVWANSSMGTVTRESVTETLLKCLTKSWLIPSCCKSCCAKQRFRRTFKQSSYDNNGSCALRHISRWERLAGYTVSQCIPPERRGRYRPRTTMEIDHGSGTECLVTLVQAQQNGKGTVFS